MKLVSQVLIALVALEHVYILWLEMFAWTTAGKRTFKSLPAHLFEQTRSLAANQGLYNGFLAAGLAWSLLITDETWSRNTGLFFLGCVTVAGIFGGLTASRKILVIQGLPAAIGLLCTLLR